MPSRGGCLKAMEQISNQTPMGFRYLGYTGGDKEGCGGGAASIEFTSAGNFKLY